jgi:hypothetical protein
MHKADSRARALSSAIGTTGCAASVRSRDIASPVRSASALAASSVKVTTQPLVVLGSKRNPCAIVAGTRSAAGAAKLSFVASNIISPPPFSISRI